MENFTPYSKNDHYPPRKEKLYSEIDIDEEEIYGLIKDIHIDYDLNAIPFIGERGKETSIRFVMIHDNDGRLTNLMVKDARVSRFLTSKHHLNWRDDIVLVKDSLSYWDMLVLDFDNKNQEWFHFISIHQKSLELAKERALQLFWEHEL